MRSPHSLTATQPRYTINPIPTPKPAKKRAAPFALLGGSGHRAGLELRLPCSRNQFPFRYRGRKSQYVPCAMYQRMKLKGDFLKKRKEPRTPNRARFR
jgi:hypothetical protein